MCTISKPSLIIDRHSETLMWSFEMISFHFFLPTRSPASFIYSPSHQC